MNAHRSFPAPALLLALLLLGPLAATPGPVDRPATSLRLSPLLPFHVLHAAHQTLVQLVRHAAATLSGQRTHTRADARTRPHA